MILTDYFYPTPSRGWALARACGVERGVIRLPETPDFDVTDKACWARLCDLFRRNGIAPMIVEPMPNFLHDHIKTGDEKRDWAIEQAIDMLPLMAQEGIGTICFNFMACVGWTRTANDLPERGDTRVTGFRKSDYRPTDAVVTEKELWDNYFYFLKAILPHAEKYGVKLALHPDDPPLPALGGVSRIMISLDNILRAVTETPSPVLGVTFCQACYYLMGEDLEQAARALKDRIFFVHFRNVTGEKTCFRETFHDNGDIDMAKMVRLYEQICPQAPVRVDHVPTLPGETPNMAGYGELARLFAIGYLKGLMEQACEKG